VVFGVDPAAPTRAWRNRVGLVLQECELDPLWTVREAISLFARFYDSPRPVEETIELVGLGDKRDARIGSLSGGQKRRADVAIGIVGDPELIFLDEPTTGFDPTARRESWNMIEGLKALGKTVFLTTHYMDEAQHLADRVAILRDGQIVAQGRTEELGESLGRRTVIGFTLDGGLSVEEIQGRASAPVQVAGNRVEIETERPQHDLYALLGLAEERGLALDELEVRRPNLEDIFLELTREESA
jgi:ABC-2 type transport system ATP-binding protein